MPVRRTGSPADAPVVDLSELERRTLWLGAEKAVHRADADLRHASSHPVDAAAQDAAQAAAASAAEVLGAVSWLVERKPGGPLHAAAEDYGRSARDLHRRTGPAPAHSRPVRAAAGALLGARLVERADTRQLLSLLARLTALSEALARLRETQERGRRPGPRGAPPNGSPASTNAGRPPHPLPCRVQQPVPCRVLQRRPLAARAG